MHKRSINRPDIFGLDKQNAFINYSFALENDNPHMCIIAKSGSGKSVSKQKIMAQMIGLNFNNGECEFLGKEYIRVRGYDIGNSDFNFIKLVQSNPKNNILCLESDFYNFSYNLVCFTNINNAETFEADLQFNTDLLSIILQTQNAEAPNISEYVTRA